MTLDEFLSGFENELSGVISKKGGPLEEELKYAALGGGKRLRPSAVFYGARAVSDSPDPRGLSSLAAAIELVHCYSLVHDDLPAMDNDDYRRGKLTVHKKFGEANAILTGDMLLTLAADTLASGACGFGIKFAEAARFITLAAAKMADGQTYDLAGMKTREEFIEMYKLKTSALFEGAFCAGAAYAGADNETLEIIGEYAIDLGLAFQLADDLIDDDPESVIGAIGHAETEALLKEYTDRAISAAGGLQRGEALAALAERLLKRSF